MAQQPLLEPGLLVTDNCKACRGTGEAKGGGECRDCEGSGRVYTEMPLSEAWELAQRTHSKLVAEPPSMLREQAVAEARVPPEKTRKL